MLKDVPGRQGRDAAATRVPSRRARSGARLPPLAPRRLSLRHCVLLSGGHDGRRSEEVFSEDRSHSYHHVCNHSSRTRDRPGVGTVRAGARRTAGSGQPRCARRQHAVLRRPCSRHAELRLPGGERHRRLALHRSAGDAVRRSRLRPATADRDALPQRESDRGKRGAARVAALDRHQQGVGPRALVVRGSAVRGRRVRSPGCCSRSQVPSSDRTAAGSCRRPHSFIASTRPAGWRPRRGARRTPRSARSRSCRTRPTTSSTGNPGTDNAS